MKTRLGFVSNSSSSSFAVVVHPDAEGIAVKVFNLLSRAFAKSMAKVSRNTVKAEREELLLEHKKLVRDLNAFEDSLAKLTDVLKDKKLTEAVHLTVKILENNNYHYLRTTKGTNCVVAAKERLEGNIYSVRSDLQKVESKLVNLIGLTDDQEVVRWTEDHMNQAMSVALEDLVKLGQVTILEKAVG